MTRASLLAAAVLIAGCLSRPAPKRVPVEIRGMQFAPDSVTVGVGDTVEWTDHDLVPHTATASAGWEAGPMIQDASARWVAAGAGKFTYHCRFHPTMTGVIIVK